MGGGSVLWQCSGSVNIFQRDSNMSYLSLSTPTISIVLYVMLRGEINNFEVSVNVTGCFPNSSMWELSN